MRKKLDPRSEMRNKEQFIAAKRNKEESIMSFVDRCRMHIRRSGSDPKEPFVIALLRLKIVECLPTVERKIFDATDPNESLDDIIHRADTMLSTDYHSQSDNEEKCHTRIKTSGGNIGNNANSTREGHTNQNDNLTESCWRCNQPGHKKRHCPLIKRPPRERVNQRGISEQGGNFTSDNLMLGNPGTRPPVVEIQRTIAQPDYRLQDINQSNSEGHLNTARLQS